MMMVVAATIIAVRTNVASMEAAMLAEQSVLVLSMDSFGVTEGRVLGWLVVDTGTVIDVLSGCE